MNFIFISPHFPDNYYLFCRALKENGVRVLGIGDMPYQYLSSEVKESLDEYYYVNSLENYEEKMRAVGYFIFRYGKIDYIESNNEYWLESDAKLRTDFNIKTGPDINQIQYFRHKSLMKEHYKEAGVACARYHMVDTFEHCLSFIKEVGYPVIIKPDNGVGAIKTCRIDTMSQLIQFFEEYDHTTSYIMEEYIEGDLISFDGVCDACGNIIVPTHHVFPQPIMDIVNEQIDAFYYTNKEIPSELIDIGQRVLKAFKAKSRFYHLEFFILKEDKVGLGKKGDYIGLEVNMRAPGGYTPDMINYAYSTNIYHVWADMIAFNENRTFLPQEKQYCVFYGRRMNKEYLHTHADVLVQYNQNLKLCDKMPKVFSSAMGDYFYIATFLSLEDVYKFRDFLYVKE